MWVQLVSAKNFEIVVYTPFFTALDDKIYLTNSHDCSWEPKCIELLKIGDHLFKTNLWVEEMEISSFEFKITRGLWENEASDSFGLPLDNHKLENDLIVLNLENWKDQGKLSPLRTIREIDFDFPHLGHSKTISIYLPPHYDHLSNKKYPVLYVHDGNNLFNLESSTFGKIWSLDHILDQLILNEVIPEVIVVGISSDNQLRYSEYDFKRTGALYAKDIIEELIPYINQNYKTYGIDPYQTFLMGSSMGALISFEILKTYPEYFSRAAGLSFPAFIHDRAVFDFLKEDQTPFKSYQQFYFDHGDFGIDSKYRNSALELYEKLINENWMGKEKLKYQIFPYADHSEIDWARRVQIPLNFLLN